jgi:hypothetical protein
MALGEWSVMSFDRLESTLSDLSSSGRAAKRNMWQSLDGIRTVFISSLSSYLQSLSSLPCISDYSSARLLFYPEDGGSRFFRHLYTHLPNYTASNLKTVIFRSQIIKSLNIYKSDRCLIHAAPVYLKRRGMFCWFAFVLCVSRDTVRLKLLRPSLTCWRLVNSTASGRRDVVYWY